MYMYWFVFIGIEIKDETEIFEYFRPSFIIKSYTTAKIQKVIENTKEKSEKCRKSLL